MNDGSHGIGTSGAHGASIDAVVERVRAVYRGWNRSTPADRMRADWDTLFACEADPAVSIEAVDAGGVAACWISPAGVAADTALLYFHGGGFQVGSTRSHRDLMSRIARAAGCRVLGADYRLAPEHRFPAAVHDARGVFRWLLGQGMAARRIVVAGDSAGAALALSIMLGLRNGAMPMPAAAVLLSAWTDLSASGASYVTHAAVDPIHQRPMILSMSRAYLGPGGDASDPLASPLFAALDGLPPMLVQVGERETLLDDSRMLARKATAAGVEVQLEVWDGMIHVFQQFAGELEQGRRAIDSIGRFVRRHLGEAQRTTRETAR